MNNPIRLIFAPFCVYVCVSMCRLMRKLCPKKKKKIETKQKQEWKHCSVCIVVYDNAGAGARLLYARVCILYIFVCLLSTCFESRKLFVFQSFRFLQFYIGNCRAFYFLSFSVCVLRLQFLSISSEFAPLLRL